MQSKVFQGGSVNDLHSMLGISNAADVLYVGECAPPLYHCHMTALNTGCSWNCQWEKSPSSMYVLAVNIDSPCILLYCSYIAPGFTPQPCSSMPPVTCQSQFCYLRIWTTFHRLHLYSTRFHQLIPVLHRKHVPALNTHANQAMQTSVSQRSRAT